MTRRVLTLIGFVAAVLLGQAGLAQEQGEIDPATGAKLFPKAPYSPYAGRNFPTRPFFGDTHVHTSYSMDAGAFGARLGPRDAYRFARGEEVTASSGQRVKLARPLDFLVVTDHSDGFGFFPLLFGGDPKILADPQGKKWYDWIQQGKGVDAAIDIITSFGKGTIQEPSRARHRGLPRAWDETIKAAEEANDPGRFTAFIGFEWTSNTAGNNLHRNILFRENGSQGQPDRALHDPEAARQRQPARPLEVDGRLRGEDRRPRARDRAQRQPVATASCFPIIESFTGKKIDREYAADARQLRAHLRGDADQGRRRDASLPLAQRRVRRLRALGQGQPRPDRDEEDRDARVRVRALGPEERPEAREGAGRQPLQVRHDRLDRHAHGAVDRRRRQLLRQDLDLRAVADSRDASLRQDGEGRDHGLGTDGLRLRRRVGDREHARSDLRRDAAQGDLRHDRTAHGGAFLRRLRF